MKKYHKVMVTTHWIVAFLMLSVIILINARTLIKKLHPDPESLKGFLFSIFIGHETLGFFLLIFCIWRVVAYFLFRDSIPESLNVKGSMSYLAEKIAHFFLRIVIIAIPVLGWLTANAKGYPLKLFWTDALRMPDLLPLGDPSQAQTNTLYQNLFAAHEYLAYLAMLVIFAHIAAVVYHTAKKEKILDRMKF